MGPEPARRFRRVRRRGVVCRPALFARLSEAGRVAVLSAPAGSGKTVLLRSWIAEAGLTERAAWVPVHGDGHDPQQFLISVADALRDTVIQGRSWLRPLTAAPDLDGWAIVEWLLQDLHSLPERVWLVIDDLHELRSAPALRQLELLMMRARADLRFVFASRRDPQLGLHGLRLDGELTEIRAADLRFTSQTSRATCWRRPGCGCPTRPWLCCTSEPRAGRPGCGWPRCRWPGTQIRICSPRGSPAASGRWPSIWSPRSWAASRSRSGAFWCGRRCWGG